MERLKWIAWKEWIAWFTFSRVSSGDALDATRLQLRGAKLQLDARRSLGRVTNERAPASGETRADSRNLFVESLLVKSASENAYDCSAGLTCTRARWIVLFAHRPRLFHYFFSFFSPLFSALTASERYECICRRDKRREKHWAKVFTIHAPFFCTLLTRVSRCSSLQSFNP